MLCRNILVRYYYNTIISKCTFNTITSHSFSSSKPSKFNNNKKPSSSKNKPPPSFPPSKNKPSHLLSSSSSFPSSSFSSKSKPSPPHSNSKPSPHSKSKSHSKPSSPSPSSPSSPSPPSPSSPHSKSKPSQPSKPSSSPSPLPSSSSLVSSSPTITTPETKPKKTITDEDLFEYSKWFFAHQCKLIKSSSKMENLPSSSLPQVAFVGRSNAGKSSLLNSLVSSANAKIARVSGTPGCTQTINFYNLYDRMVLADLPGYGYAKVPQNLKRAWIDFISQYLSQSEHLKRTFVLIDSRHGLLQADHEFIQQLDEFKKPYQIILTKSDKQMKGLKETVERVIEELKRYKWCVPGVLITSSTKKMGMDEVKASCMIATELSKERIGRYLEKMEDKELMSQLDHL